LGVQARNSKWTSYGALEVDIFAPSRSDFQLFLAALEPLGDIEFVHDLNEEPQFKDEAALYSEARDLFNSERYWESHEVLEGIWRNLKGEEKAFVQGVILVCAAFVHHQKGEDSVGLGVLRRASKQLSFRGREFHGIDVNALEENVARMLSSESFTIFRI